MKCFLSPSLKPTGRMAPGATGAGAATLTAPLTLPVNVHLLGLNTLINSRLRLTQATERGLRAFSTFLLFLSTVLRVNIFLLPFAILLTVFFASSCFLCAVDRTWSILSPATPRQRWKRHHLQLRLKNKYDYFNLSMSINQFGQACLTEYSIHMGSVCLMGINKSF